jgi:hypothetical protein
MVEGGMCTGKRGASHFWETLHVETTWREAITTTRVRPRRQGKKLLELQPGQALRIWKEAVRGEDEDEDEEGECERARER